MNLSIFDYYLIGINIISFLIFIPYIFFFADDEANWYDSMLTIISLCFGSLGLLLSICIFGRTPYKEKKATMMSRIFIWCILVIQIILVLIFKGFIKTDITINIINFFRDYMWILFYIFIINMISLVAFALDKIFAIERRNRIRISVLLFLSFIGGSIGALVAMYVFRHKTSIDYFTVGVPLTLIMQIIALFYLMNMSF